MRACVPAHTPRCVNMHIVCIHACTCSCTCMCVCHYSSVTDGGTSTGYLQSVQHVLADISEVYVLESAVAHMELGYSGTCDCIATYRLEVHFYMYQCL